MRPPLFLPMMSNDEQYLTTKQVADLLGLQDPETVSRYAAEGRIPGALKLGNRWRYPRSQLRFLSTAPSPGVPEDRPVPNPARQQAHRSDATSAKRGREKATRNGHKRTARQMRQGGTGPTSEQPAGRPSARERELAESRRRIAEALNRRHSQRR